MLHVVSANVISCVIYMSNDICFGFEWLLKLSLSCLGWFVVRFQTLHVFLSSVIHQMK